MAPEKLTGRPESKTSLEKQLASDRGARMVAILGNQARLVFRYYGPSYLKDRTGIPIAKPWHTPYRGEVFMYVPDNNKAAPIDFPVWEYDERPVGKGIVGIARLTGISRVTTEEDWAATFEQHREKGHIPFMPTYLWFLDPVRQFRKPLAIRVGGKWVEEEELPGYTVPSNVGEYILPPLRRELHRIDLSTLLREI